MLLSENTDKMECRTQKTNNLHIISPNKRINEDTKMKN